MIGHGLSQVQVSAVYLRELQGRFEKRDDNAFSLKAAILATGRVPFSELFPDEDTDEDNAAALFKEGGEPTLWKFEESAEFDPEEAERMLNDLLHESSFTVPSAEVEQHAKRLRVDWGEGE